MKRGFRHSEATPPEERHLNTLHGPSRKILDYLEGGGDSVNSATAPSDEEVLVEELYAAQQKLPPTTEIVEIPKTSPAVRVNDLIAIAPPARPKDIRETDIIVPNRWRHEYADFSEEQRSRLLAYDEVCRLFRLAGVYDLDQYSSLEEEIVMRLFLAMLHRDSSVLSAGHNLLNNRDYDYSHIREGVRDELDIFPGFFERYQARCSDKTGNPLNALPAVLRVYGGSKNFDAQNIRPLPEGFESVDVAGAILNQEEIIYREHGWLSVKNSAYNYTTFDDTVKHDISMLADAGFAEAYFNVESGRLWTRQQDWRGSADIRQRLEEMLSNPRLHDAAEGILFSMGFDIDSKAEGSTGHLRLGA